MGGKKKGKGKKGGDPSKGEGIFKALCTQCHSMAVSQSSQTVSLHWTCTRVSCRLPHRLTIRLRLLVSSTHPPARPCRARALSNGPTPTSKNGSNPQLISRRATPWLSLGFRPPRTAQTSSPTSNPDALVITKLSPITHYCSRSPCDSVLPAQPAHCRPLSSPVTTPYCVLPIEPSRFPRHTPAPPQPLRRLSPRAASARLPASLAHSSSSCECRTATLLPRNRHSTPPQAPCSFQRTPSYTQDGTAHASSRISPPIPRRRAYPRTRPSTSGNRTKARLDLCPPKSAVKQAELRRLKRASPKSHELSAELAHGSSRYNPA